MTAAAIQTFQVQCPVSAADVAAEQREIEALATPAALASIVVSDESTYQAADAFLTEVLSSRDAIVTMRKSATGPLYTVVKTIESWFKPYVDASAKVENRLRDQMRGWLSARAKAEDEARALALTAAKARDTAGMVQALTVAADAAQKPVAGASVRYVWRVGGVVESALPAEFWAPNMTLLALVASQAGPDGPEPIPGVTFVREAILGAKRK